MDEEKIVPTEIVETKNAVRDALCIILGLKSNCSDDDLIDGAKKFEEKTQ